MARRPSLLRDYAEALVLAVLLATFVRTFLLQAYRIPSSSMAEGLQVGDHILINKTIYRDHLGDPDPPWFTHLLPVRDVRRGDVVIFRFPRDPRREFVKRCVGLPGDRIEIVDKTLHVNEAPVDDFRYTLRGDERTFSNSHFLEERYRYRDNFGPYVVPPAHYFCLGDNRDLSNDSRFWGPVPASHVVGRAWLIYWSTDDRETRPINAITAGTWDTMPIDTEPTTRRDGVSRLRATRWSRMLTVVR
ncbi:MAG: signal peptidase I [Acidobacteriota bacterium]